MTDHRTGKVIYFFYSKAKFIYQMEYLHNGVYPNAVSDKGRCVFTQYGFFSKEA